MARKKDGGAAVEPKALKVHIGAVGVQQDTIGAPFKFERSELELGAADALLTGARLEVLMEHVGENAKQGVLFEGAEPPQVESVADVRRLSVGSKDVGGRLTFRREDTDLEALATFAARDARITVKRIGDSAAAPEGGAEE